MTPFCHAELVSASHLSFRFDWTFELCHLTSLINMVELADILKNLPHAFPFRMVDRILAIEKGKRAIALKNVSIDEPYFLGHFPGKPVMPWVLVLEAMAQTGGLAFQSSFESEGEGVPVLARIEEFRLKKSVTPGDQIIIEAEILHVFSNLAKLKVLARVEDEIVAEGTLVIARGQDRKL